MDTSFYTQNDCIISKVNDSVWNSITHLIIDVDGTMTDGGVYYDENGNELKKFNTRDAAGFFAAKNCGIKIMVLTGRECFATERRMKELQVEYIYQDIKDKKSFIEKFISEHGLYSNNIGYIGDDLNDYTSMQLCGFIGCPADACEEIKRISNYISTQKGGEGAVRDIICYLLKNRGQWERAIQNAYHMGV